MRVGKCGFYRPMVSACRKVMLLPRRMHFCGQPSPCVCCRGKYSAVQPDPSWSFITLMTDYFEFLQWPAMILTILAAWLTSSDKEHRREIGFWLYLVSNVVWVAWAWHVQAHALIILQFA